MNKNNFDWNYWVVRFLFVMALIVGYLLITNYQHFVHSVSGLLGILSPFITGFVIAYLLSGSQKKIEGLLERVPLPVVKKAKHGLSVLLLYLIILFIFVLTLNYIVPLLISNLVDLANSLPTFYDHMVQFVMSLEDKGILKTAAIEKYLNSVLKDLSPERFLNQWTQALFSLGTLTKNVSSFFLNAFLTLIISIYALVFKQSILTFVEKAAHKLLSEKVYKQTQTWLNTTNKIFYKFISCQFLDACIIGVSSTILLSILNVKFAVTLGILLGICNMIPYFGSIFASIVAGVITLFTGGVTQAITVLLVLLILQQIDGNIIGPRIMGDALNVNPILIIVSITIGGAYFGVLGMFLAVPVAAIIKIIVSEWLNESKEIDKIVDSIES